MEQKREAIKRKIKALLAKTTENGASEHEAYIALNKATQLMSEYTLSMKDIDESVEPEKCISLDVLVYKTSYNSIFIIPALCKLFDCYHVYDPKVITFFGFEQDVRLAEYFYNFIMKACISKKDEYMRSSDALSLKKRGYHGRAIASSFVSGFLVGVYNKIDDIYAQRNATMPQEFALVIVDKKEQVGKEFDIVFPCTRTVENKANSSSGEASNAGYNEGKSVHITQAIDDADVVTNKRKVIA
ncbi:MAG: DUF2786 domain-containing protein [Bacteroidales bacterium]